MTSSWDVYSIVFLSALLSLSIPLLLGGVSYLFSGAYLEQKKKKDLNINRVTVHKMNRTLLGQRINIRFFLAANAALVLITLVIELVPCVTVLKASEPQEILQGLFAVVSLSSFAMLGLLYSAKKGDLSWLSSFHTDFQKDRKNE